MVLGLAQLRKRKTQKRGRPIHFSYRVQLLEIKPWLPSEQPSPQTRPTHSFILRWHRGHRRSGIAQSCTAPSGGKILFSHAFKLPVTLYCSSSSSAFEEKIISFTLLDAEYSNGPPLARSALDLAAYATSEITRGHETTVCVPLIPCVHVSSKAGVPNLHILITSSASKPCFGKAKWQAKAYCLARYLPVRTMRLLKKQGASPPPSDCSSHQALVAALLKDEDEHLEEEEAEIEAFTDDESLSGLHTPSENDTSCSHHEENTTLVDDDESPQENSRFPVAQVAWTPSPKRPHSDEMFCPVRTASEFYSSNEVVPTSCRGVKHMDSYALPANSPSSPSPSKQMLVDDHKCPSYSDERALHTNNPSFLHQDVKAVEGKPDEKRNRKPTDGERTSESCEQIEHHIDAGLSARCRISEAEALRLRIIDQLHESKVCRLKFDDLDSELMEDDDLISVEVDTNVLEEARRKFAEGAEKRDAKVTKRLLEETKVKLAEAEAKLLAASEKASFLQLRIDGLEGELQDVAVIEMFIYCTVDEHGGSPCSVLTCAYHLAKLHKLAFTKWSCQRRASLMRSTFSGLILATRACGQDVARLTFWWSNVLALRHACSLALETLCSEIAGEPTHVVSDGGKDSGLSDSTKCTLPIDLAVLESEFGNWRNSSTFCTALQKIEAWIYAKIVESIWCQVFAPLTQKSSCSPLQEEISLGNFNKDDIVCSKDHESLLSVLDLEDEMPQNNSIDIWKKAYLDALQKLCPVQAGGKTCSCIPGLPRLVIEECVARIDVLMFNAILPCSDMDASSNPVSDAVFGVQVLPIPPRHFTFGAGIQLKNVISTWSTWLTISLEKLGNMDANAVSMDEARRFISFPLLKALADLLMLPRDMVADKCVRKEVCPALTLPVVRKIIATIEPDKFAPDAVSPSLLAALNAEIDMEKRMYGDDLQQHGFSAHGLALEPRVAYCSQTTAFKLLTGSMLDSIVSEWGMQDGVVNKVLHDLKTALTGSLQACHEVMSRMDDQAQDVQKHIDSHTLLHRYMLLQELWASELTDPLPSGVQP